MPVADQSRSLGSGPVRTDGVPAAAGESCSQGEKRGLLIVGCYKLLEGLFFIGVGFGALHLIHKNIGDLVMRLMYALPVDPEGRMVGLIMDRADLINAHDLRRIGALAFLYACTRLVEGTGLLLHKTWAEFLTVGLTIVGLPIEIFELMKKVTWMKAGAFAVNVVILAYLLWVLKRQQHTRGKTA